MMLLGAGFALLALSALAALAAYRWGRDTGQLDERSVWLEREATQRAREELRLAQKVPPVEFLLGRPAEFDTRELRAAP